jgi:hypothetical protein
MQQAQIGASKGSASTPSKAAVATFLPAASNTNASAFFNRDGGILDNAKTNQPVVAGPLPGADILADIAARTMTTANQDVATNFPGVNDLFKYGFRF